MMTPTDGMTPTLWIDNCPTCKAVQEMDANERFEYVAAQFKKETGLMAPGKSQPSENPTHEERMEAWKKWIWHCPTCTLHFTALDSAVAEAVAREREECAILARGYCRGQDESLGGNGYWQYQSNLTIAIRARTKEEAGGKHDGR